MDTTSLALDRIEHDHCLQLCCEGGVLARPVRLALSPWRRLRGLLGGPPLGEQEALLLRPCNGIHTMFMAYAIDVLFIDRGGRVVDLVAALGPWRATGLIGGARAAIELRAGRAEQLGVERGQLVTFEPRV